MLINRILNWLYKRKIKKELFFIGECSFVNRTVRFKNAKYISLGHNVLIERNSRIEAWDNYSGEYFSPNLVIGNNVKINENCHIGCIDSITIGDDCLLGANVMIIDHSHGKTDKEEIFLHPAQRKLYSKGKVKIGSKVWLCENSIILPGVSIGDCSIVGAGAVVTKNVPKRCIVVGNPARIIKYI